MADAPTFARPPAKATTVTNRKYHAHTLPDSPVHGKIRHERCRRQRCLPCRIPGAGSQARSRDHPDFPAAAHHRGGLHRLQPGHRHLRPSRVRWPSCRSSCSAWRCSSPSASSSSTASTTRPMRSPPSSIPIRSRRTSRWCTPGRSTSSACCSRAARWPSASSRLLPVELILQVGSGAGFAMVFALLIAAIIWNLGTWWLGLPASSFAHADRLDHRRRRRQRAHARA